MLCGVVRLEPSFNAKIGFEKCASSACRDIGSLLASVQVDTIARDCTEAGYGYGYRYKDCLPIGILGLVDDTIGITKAGHKALMLNSFLNVKTAEKYLQFGAKKCKSMLVGKDTGNIYNDKLVVDNWSKEYVENRNSGEIELVENYQGKLEIENVTEQKYLQSPVLGIICKISR